MGFNNVSLREGAFIFIIVVVALFSTASFGINLYTIVEAFKWLEEFDTLSGRGSNNWNWTVVILVFAFGGVAGNGCVIAYTYRNQSSEFRYRVILGLLLASVVHLSITTPTLDAVRKYRWAEILRKAGHADHASYVDVFYKFGKILVIFWSAIGFICLAAVSCVMISAFLHRQSMRNFWEESNKTKEHRSQLQADVDVERGDDQKHDPRLRSEPGPLNQHPIYTEEERGR
jgi:divalent metal cation (Fe/Co/Zn/Cd) transporter